VFSTSLHCDATANVAIDETVIDSDSDEFRIAEDNQNTEELKHSLI
jgi:hypothetical protein